MPLIIICCCIIRYCRTRSETPKTDLLTTRLILYKIEMSRVVRKPAFCLCENKAADQLRGNREADLRLCFRYTESTIPLFLNPKFQASSHLLWLYSPVCFGPGWKPRRPAFSQRGLYYLSTS